MVEEGLGFDGRGGREGQGGKGTVCVLGTA
jgi:hypothetical protein